MLALNLILISDLGNKWFQGKGQKHNDGNNPPPEGKADWRDAVIQAAGNDKIT